MPKDHSTPINEADRQARAAAFAYNTWRHSEDGESFYPPELNLRTWQRIVRGERDVPPGLARQLSALIREDMTTARNRDQLDGWAVALDLWTYDCDKRSALQKVQRLHPSNGVRGGGNA